MLSFSLNSSCHTGFYQSLCVILYFVTHPQCMTLFQKKTKKNQEICLDCQQLIQQEEQTISRQFTMDWDCFWFKNNTYSSIFRLDAHKGIELGQFHISSIFLFQINYFIHIYSCFIVDVFTVWIINTYIVNVYVHSKMYGFHQITCLKRADPCHQRP